MPASYVQTIGPHLPGLRRYARALSGDQEKADALIRNLLRRLPFLSVRPSAYENRATLYRQFSQVNRGLPSERPQSPSVKIPQMDRSLQSLYLSDRQVLLLVCLEGFSLDETADIVDLPAAHIAGRIKRALEDMRIVARTPVLFLGRDSELADKVAACAEGLGFTIASRAATLSDAVANAHLCRPGLLISDAIMSDGSCGMCAAGALQQDFDIPAIFLLEDTEPLADSKKHFAPFAISPALSRESIEEIIEHALFTHSI